MPIDRVVANASPLISLFRSGLEDLLAQLWQEVAVPGAVWDEVLAGPEADPAVLVLAKKRGLLPSVTEALEVLTASGLWISDDIVRMLRRQAGE